MPSDSNLVRWELEQFLQGDVEDLQAMREKAILIHRGKDIDAAGDEVEISVRKYLRSRIPNDYHIGHGHIVDRALNQSPQLDVIITSNGQTPVLFQGANGTEYSPYESVYCLGEIKSTYYKSKRHIQHFSDVIRRIREGLHRETVPLTHLGNGLNAGAGMNVVHNFGLPYRNPLLTFMIFVDKGDFNFQDIKEFYQETESANLPNVVCFVNGGVISYVSYGLTEDKNIHYHWSLQTLYPELVGPEVVNHSWSHAEFNIVGGSVAHLLFTLLLHLQSTMLKPPSISEYMNGLLSAQSVQVLPRKRS